MLISIEVNDAGRMCLAIALTIKFTRFTHHMHRMKITSNKVIIYML